MEESQADDRSVYARKEVILSAGAIDSPKLLLLSGIGPESELAEHGIEQMHDIPGIGKNLRDHLWTEIVTVQKAGSPHRSSYIHIPALLEEARLQWSKDKSGPLSYYFLPQMIAYLKSDSIVQSTEFRDLDHADQK